MTTMETHTDRSGPASLAAAPPASFEGWQALVVPGDVFRHPRDVLAHPMLSRDERREILAAWASDANALEGAPALRRLRGGRAEPVPVDDVLAALAALDGSESLPPATLPFVRSTPRRRPRDLAGVRRLVRRRRDDDDPPPCPAMAMPRPRTPPGVDAAALPIPA